MSLFDTMERYNARKLEHLTQAQRAPSPRDTGADDRDVMGQLLVGAGIDGEEALTAAGVAADAILRDLARAGQLRGAKRPVLRAVLVAAWVDGLGTGAMHVKAGE
jgi:hypothetical protein